MFSKAREAPEEEFEGLQHFERNQEQAEENGQEEGQESDDGSEEDRECARGYLLWDVVRQGDLDDFLLSVFAGDFA